jgi:hypothetical protein
VLRYPQMALPAQGRLWVRDVRVTTRMSRTVRYLIPAFTPSAPEGQRDRPVLPR